MGIPERRGRRRSGTFLVILLLSAGLHFLSAEEGLNVEVLPDPVGMNDRFTISFVVDTPSASVVDAGDWDFPEGVRLYAGPYIRGVVETREDGSSYPAASVSYILRSSLTGRILFPGIPYSVGSSSYTTAPFIVRVGTYRSRELILPLEVNWEYPEGPVYEGQTIPVVIVVENQEEIILPEGVSVSASSGGFFEEAPELGEIRSRIYGGSTLYTVPVMGYLYTPTSPGRFFLNKATVTAGNLRGTGPAVALDVFPLPSAVASSGAVGLFEMSTAVFPDDPEEGDEITVTVRISGEGNLAYLTPPEPDFGGLTLLRSSEDYVYNPSRRGYKGFRETAYILEAGSTGSYTIEVPGFYSMDTVDNREVAVAGSRLSIDISPGGIPAADSGLYNPVSLLFTRDELLETQPHRLYTLPWIYALFVPGPVLLLFLRRRKKKLMYGSPVLLLPLLLFLTGSGSGTDLLQQADMAYSAAVADRFTEAAELYRDLVSDNPQNGRLFFNLAVCYEEAGNRSYAMTALLGAARRGISDPETSALMEEIQGNGEYIRQFPLPEFFNPDISFVLLLVFYNLFFATLILRVFRRPVNLLLASLLMATLAICSGGLLLHGLLVSMEKLGVIAADVTSHRIPRSTARDWVELPEGLAVKVRQESDTFCLVQTAYGAEGWISTDSLIFEKELLGEGEKTALGGETALSKEKEE